MLRLDFPHAMRTPAVALAFGILAGGLVQVAMQVPALARRGMKFPVRVSVSDPGVRKFGRLMAPSFFGMGVYQINLFVDTIFATSSRMPSGKHTSLYVADRVMELVLGSYAIAMSTVLLPTMSHQAAMGKFDEMKHTFGFSLRIVSFITIPAAVGLILLRGPIIQVLFQHGQFVAESTSLTAHALLFYSLGLPAYAAIRLITPMYYSTQDTMTPARVGAVRSGMNIVLNGCSCYFFRIFRTAVPRWRVRSRLISTLFCCLAFSQTLRSAGAQGRDRLVCKMAVCAWVWRPMAYAALHSGEFRGRAASAGAGRALAAMIAGRPPAFISGWHGCFVVKSFRNFFFFLRRSDAKRCTAPRRTPDRFSGAGNWNRIFEHS